MIFNDLQTICLEDLWRLHDVLIFLTWCNPVAYERSLKQLQSWLPELRSAFDSDVLTCNEMPPIKPVDATLDHASCIDAALDAIEYGRKLSPSLKDDLGKVLITIEHYVDTLCYHGGIFDPYSYHQIEASKEFDRGGLAGICCE